MTTFYNSKATFSKFLITVPKNYDLWFLSASRRKSPELIYRLLERKIDRILRTGINEKIVVKVKYTDGTTNETLKSSDASYLLYSTACFLEDYLSIEGLTRLYKKYSLLN